MKKFSILALAILLPFLFFFINGRKIILVERIDSSKILVSTCFSFSNSNCSFNFLKQSRFISPELFFKTLEFSLLTPGDYTQDMLENIKSYKKDLTEINQEKDRKVSQFKLNLAALDFLESKKSSLPKFSSEIELLDEIQNLNARLRSYIEIIKKNPKLFLAFSNQDDCKILYSTFAHFVVSSIPSISFVQVPAGSFTMGQSSKYIEANEIKNFVVISKKFELAKFETTQTEWFTVMGYNPSFFSSEKYCPQNFTKFEGISLCPNHPVETVSFDEVNLFITRLNTLDNKYNYRLPTEAEWEYSSRANNQTTYFFGEDDSKLGEFAWYFENSSHQTHEVGLKNPNQFGLYDILGNVFEWTSDYYSDLSSNNRQDPFVDKISPWKVTKGGSWYARPKGLRPAFRCKDEKNFRYSRIGFRLLRESKNQ